MLRLKLIRVKLADTYTEGALINLNTNEVLCDTLEDRVRDIDGNGKLEGDDEQKIYGKTAIPYGTYHIRVTYSPKFKRDMVAIQNVPHFTGIRMHWGRTAEQSGGCPLVGEKSGDGELSNSGMTDGLVKLLKSHGNIGEITIV